MSIEGWGCESCDGGRDVGAGCFDRDVVVIVKVDSSGLFVCVTGHGKEFAF